MVLTLMFSIVISEYAVIIAKSLTALTSYMHIFAWLTTDLKVALPLNISYFKPFKES